MKISTRFVWISIILSLCITYFTYLPYKENDVVGLCNSIMKLKESANNFIYVSPRAKSDIEGFDQFTNGYFLKERSFNFLSLDSTNSKGGLLVSRVHHKFGPKEKTANEEISVQELIENKKVRLINKVDGYNIYLILRE